MKKQSTIFCSIVYFGILLLILYTYPPTIEYLPLTSKTEFDTIYSTDCVDYNGKLINDLGKKCVEQHNNKTCSLYNKQPVYRCDSDSTSTTYPDKSQADKDCNTPKTSLFITDGMESCIEDEATVYYETNGGSDKTYIVNNSNSRSSSKWDSSGYYGKHVEYITSEGCKPNKRSAICKKTLPP
jgi:hypothetical protein